MTDIASVRETYMFLRSIVVDSQAKLTGLNTRFEIVMGGIDIHVSQDGVANRQFASWEELIDMPQVLALKAGMAAGELVSMREFRDARRKQFQRPAAGDGPDASKPQ